MWALQFDTATPEAYKRRTGLHGGTNLEAHMYKLVIGVIGAAFLVATASPAIAKTETVKGQIVDQACYLKDKANNVGKDHKMPADTKDCAVGCAKQGHPLALLTSDGKVYEIAGDLADNKNEKLIAHISHTVEITGDTMGSGDSMMIHASELKMVSAK